jgi:hypothetical protein
VNKLIICLLFVVCKCFAVDLVWEKDLEAELSGLTITDSAGLLVQSANNEVGVLLYSDSANIILVVDEFGEIKYSDQFSDGHAVGFRGELSWARFSVRMIIDSANYIRVYEYNGSEYSVTNIPYNGHSLDQYESYSSDVFYTLEGTVLKKYQFEEVASYLAGSVVAGIDGSNFKLSWETVSGTHYQIQSSVNLTNWTSVGEAIIGTGATMNWANSISNSSSYYRVHEY